MLESPRLLVIAGARFLPAISDVSYEGFHRPMLLPWKSRPAVSLPGAAPEGTLQTTDEEKA
jgi:hypothetical protein